MVESSQLAGLDEETLASISKEMAEKYKAIPFKKEKNRLHVVMLDPKNMNAVDEFRFVSGYDIIPYAASELRILYALEKYYGVKRDLRYISIFDHLKKRKNRLPPQIPGNSKDKRGLCRCKRKRRNRRAAHKRRLRKLQKELPFS